MQTSQGQLFTSPNVDDYREFFRNKSKKLVNKVTSVNEAVKTHIKNGDYVAVGGFGGNRIPTAILHEIVRQKKKNLGLSGHTATHDGQILMAGNCIDRCDIAYIVGLEARGLSKNARKQCQSGQIKMTEWSNGALAWRYKAAAMGLPFMPARVMMGTDTFKYSAAKEIECPFTQQKLLAVPALFPDVAVIHVHRSDVYGNCQIDGITVADDDVAKASKTVIITTEKIIPNSEFRREPNKTVIPYWCVDAVIEQPYGAYPANMPGLYFSDEDHLKEWLAAEQDTETFNAFLEKYIYSSKDFYAYLNKKGGVARMVELANQEKVAE